jgi:PAS domain S-box-containing protein
MRAPWPANEAERLQTLQRYAILDTAAEREFDDLVRLAAHICETPIAAVTFIDRDRQWLKARLGIETCETPRDLAFCAHTILDPYSMLEVEDTRKDPRFADHPGVTSNPGIRFYLGAPLTTPEQHALGSLCVVDYRPRTLTDSQREALQALSRQAIAQLERRRALNERMHAVNLVDRFFSLSLDMLCVANRESYFVRLNPSFSQILGWTLEELMAKPFFAFVHPDDLEHTHREAARLGEGLQTLDFKNRYRCKDGSYRWFAWRCASAPEDGLIFASARDITDQVYVEDEIKRSEERFRMMVEAAPHAMVMMADDGRITLINNEAENLFGYPRRELLGKSIYKLIPKRAGASHLVLGETSLSEAVTRSMAAGGHLVGRRKDGGEIYIEVGLSPLWTAEGEFLLASIVNVSERIRAERFKSEFISVVSHELRTPLTSIRGSLGLVNSGVAGELPAKAKQLIDVAWRNTDRLADLINDILDIEKIESGHVRLDLETQQLGPLVQQAIEANTGYAQNLDVRLILEENVPDLFVSVDTHRLLQVFANLLSNAAKFSPRGCEVHVGITRTAKSCRIAVRDQGPGVPTEFQPRVFQKFSQADCSDRRQKGGTGLGLAISKALVEGMNGNIGFESVPGRGATFYIDLPLTSAPTTHEPQEHSQIA